MTDRMRERNPAARDSNDFVTMAAHTLVLGQVSDNATKAQLMLDALASHPRLEIFYRNTYNARRWWSLRTTQLDDETLNGLIDLRDDEPNEDDLGVIKGLPFYKAVQMANALPYPAQVNKWQEYRASLGETVRPLADMLLDRRLPASPALTAKVFAKAGLEPLDNSQVSLHMGYCNLDQRFASATLCDGALAGDACRKSIGVCTVDLWDTWRWLRACNVACIAHEYIWFALGFKSDDNNHWIEDDSVTCLEEALARDFTETAKGWRASRRKANYTKVQDKLDALNSQTGDEDGD